MGGTINWGIFKRHFWGEYSGILIDERGRETEQAPRSIATAPVLDSTKIDASTGS
jgi:hypothetical protein